MPHYHAHGLAITANQSIPELVESVRNGAADLQILFGEWPAGIERFASRESWFQSDYRTADGQAGLVASRRGGGRWFQFEYAGGPTFLVDAAASTIWVNGPPDISSRDASAYLLGPIMGIALRLRGVVCLHASAVEVGGQAIAFAGPAGAGKSTLAATCATAGFHVLSDDIVTLRPHDDAWFVAPGYPRIRLWPDALPAVDLEADAPDPGARVHVDLNVHGLFARNAVPLVAVYLIEFDDRLTRPFITALGSAEALPELAANSFANRVLDRRRRVEEFTVFADLLEAVPVRRLARARDLHALQAVRAAVLDDLAATRLLSAS